MEFLSSYWERSSDEYFCYAFSRLLERRQSIRFSPVAGQFSLDIRIVVMNAHSTMSAIVLQHTAKYG